MVSWDYYNTAQCIHVALCIIGEHVLINYFLFQTWYPNSKPYPFLQHCQHDVSIFSRGKRTISDLCQDIMKYFHDGSFTKKQQWALPRNKETIGAEETLTPAFPDSNDPSYGSEIQLAHFCLFSFPFLCFYASPAGLTLEREIYYKKACSRISVLVSTSMGKVKTITRMQGFLSEPPIFKS